MTPWTVPSNSIGTRSIDSGPSVDWTTSVRGSAIASPRRTGSPWAATQPVSPFPIATRRTDGSGLVAPMNVALEADRFAHRGLVIDPIDADRVVLDERAGPGHDRLGDALDVLESVQPAGEFGDRLEPVGHRPRRIRPAGRCRWRSPCGRRRRARPRSPRASRRSRGGGTGRAGRATCRGTRSARSRWFGRPARW